jgi:hypothetical protein
LYYFVSDASANPTFYADRRNPQSLNKYQYSYNNPLRYVDPDGHAPDQKCKCPTDAEIIETVTTALDKVADATGITSLAEAIRRGGSAAFKGALNLIEKYGDRTAPCNDCIYNSESQPKEVVIDGSKHPEAAANAADAQKAGRPSELTVDRAGAADRRRESLQGTKPVPGKDRDEYPPAVFKEGGRGAQVRPINPSDNRGAGASIGQQIKDVPNGDKVKVTVINWLVSLVY